MALLRIVEGARKGTSVTIGEKATLGRARECDIQVKDVESSRLHAEVRLVHGRYYVKDLGSSNGTLVNDERITEQELHHGDRIRIGEFVIEFVGEEEGAGDASDLAHVEVLEPVQPEPSEQAAVGVLEPVEAAPPGQIPPGEETPPALSGRPSIQR